MADIPPVLQPRKTEKLVESSFLLGILSIACGITALPAIIQSIRALIWIRKEKVSKTAFRKVVFSLIFSSCVLGFGVFSIASAFCAAQSLADRIGCISNLKELTLAIRVYSGDHNDVFPPAQWCDVILTNAPETSNNQINVSVFHCPTAPKKQKCSYAFNRQLIGIKETDEIAPDTVMLFESDVGWNAVGGLEIIAKRHYAGGINVALVDGHVEQIQAKDIPNLRWNPFTNSTAK